jgi:hypothetical protein
MTMKKIADDNNTKPAVGYDCIVGMYGVTFDCLSGGTKVDWQFEVTGIDADRDEFYTLRTIWGGGEHSGPGAKILMRRADLIKHHRMNGVVLFGKLGEMQSFVEENRQETLS